MSGQIDFTQVDSPVAPTAGVTALSFPATATNQLKWVDADGGTNIIAGGGFTLTVPATGTVALTGLTLAQFAATTSTELAGVLSDETGSGGGFVRATSPTLTTPALGTPSALVLTNATGLPTAGLVDAAVTLAKMANLAQDQFIGRTTASTGVPETATITAAARTVLDDVTVAAMVNTLGGAAAVGSGGLARATSPVFGTQISTPAIVAPAALTITPAAGSGVNIVLSTTGDFAINTDDLYVDTSTGFTGIGINPDWPLHVGITNWTQTENLVLGANDFTTFAIASSRAATSGMGIAAIYQTGISSGTQAAMAQHVIFDTTGAGAVTKQAGVLIRNLAKGTNNSYIVLGTDTIPAANYAIYSATTNQSYFNGNIGIKTTLPTNDLSFNGNSARIFWLERHTTANTAGNALTVQAGGATASATDKAGGDLILLPGASTGTGRANVRLRNYSRATATGTADNTAVDRLIVAGAVTLTDAATSMFEVALAAGASAGGCILWTIRASDGTDHQAFSGVTTFSAVNKAGVYTTTVTTNANNDAKAVSAGTLTATFSLLNGASKVTMQTTPAGSLTETLYQMSYTLFNNSPAAITIL